MTYSKLILASLVAITLLGASCSRSNNTNTYSTSTNGRIVVSVTDAATNLDNINSVILTVNKIELQSSTQGWVTLSTEPKAYNLLELKESGVAKLLVDTDVKADTYNQIRLQVDKVTVTADGQAQTTAKLPSNTIKIMGKVVVNADATSSVVLDFLLDQSLYVTGNGQYILLPVIKVEGTSNSQVDVKSDSSVEVRGGKKDLDITVGTDVSGDTQVNLPVYVNIDLTNQGVIKAGGGAEAEQGLKVDAQKAVDLAIASGQIATAISAQLETKNNVKVWRVTGIKGLLTATVYVDTSTGVIVQ